MIKDEDIEKIVELFKKQTEKECYKIIVDDAEPNILDDKLGGRPYLPEGEEYPTDKNGNPLALLLQVNLKNIDLKGWKKEGILEIFSDCDWPLNYVVKVFKEGQKYQTQFPEISTENQFMQKPMTITLEKTVTYMSPNDYRYSDLISKIAGQVLGVSLKNWGDVYDYFGEQYDDFETKIYDCSQVFASIGGYPDFTQEDPRYDIDPNPDECIFKIDSSGFSEDYIIIGDSGIVCGYINEKDLVASQFDKMIVDWDCC